MRDAQEDARARLAPQSKLVLHSQFADYMQGKKIRPVNLEISPSGVCQASCDFCFYANTGELGEHRKVFLQRDRLLRLLEEAAEIGVKGITWTGGGDPSLHPDIGEALASARELGLRQGMFTNCLAYPKYNPELLDWVRVTVTDKPLAREYLRELRPVKTFSFAFNYAGPQDDEYLKHVLGMAAGLDASYVQVRPALKFHGETVDIQPPQFSHPLMFITDYKFEEAKKKHGYSRCEGYHMVPFCWEDGNLDVCAYNRLYPGYTLGNIYKSSLAEILDNAPASVPVHDKCQVCCKLNEINGLIHAARKLEDVAFP